MKVISVAVACVFLYQVFFPTISYALTGGPSQPEVQSFEPIGTTEMVDLFTGDFTYNIPLLEVDGYPLNLAYHSGVSMDQEASFVGLGWNLNPGAITRTVRSIPDEFKGDEITQQFSMKPNISVGLNGGVTTELAGFEGDRLKELQKVAKMTYGQKYSAEIGLSFGLGLVYNNYKGFGYELSLSPGLSGGVKNLGSLNLNLGLSAGSQSGFGFTPSLSYGRTAANEDGAASNGTTTLKLGYNSRTGLKALSLKTDKSTTHSNANQKKETESLGRGFNHSVKDFANPTYYPSISMPMKNYILSLSANVGSEAWTAFPSFYVSGYYSVQSLAQEEQSSNAYGYLYAHEASRNSLNIYDFNREKDVPYNEYVLNLPLTNFTYDLYSISGQGTGGMFRPFRSDIGTVNDRRNSNSSSSDDLGAEVGFGKDIEWGGDYTNAYSNTRTGAWYENNEVWDIFTFKDKDEVSSNYQVEYEPFYYKLIGEKQVIDTVFYNYLDQEKAVMIRLNENGNKVSATNTYCNSENPSGSKTIGTTNYRKSRAKRSQLVSTLTVEELEKLGQTALQSYPMNSFMNSSNKYSWRTSGFTEVDIHDNDRKAHHVGAYIITNPDGRRYVYGLPAYNLKQEEVSFSIASDGMSPNYENGLISYDTTVDNTKNNEKGLSHFFSKKEIPAYAHSYLLTAILSADYVDVTGDGVTDDDLGTAVRFNYTRLYPNESTSAYKWRVPFKQGKASYDEVQKSNPNDDQASYVYGEKEVWLIHSVESRNYLVQFHYSDREDSHGVESENGGNSGSTRSLKKLDEIRLYSKKGKLTGGVTPIKTVHFQYSYELCKNVPNNSGIAVDVDGNPVSAQSPDNVNANKGKLTLKKLYFTYRNQPKGQINSYVFAYDGPNPEYNLKAYDRWGNFKRNKTALPNSEYPYTEQDKDTADYNASAWSLTDIGLPSGGNIHVSYESDDYAYVQDKRAMQMFKIIGTGFESDTTALDARKESGYLYAYTFEGSGFDKYDPCNVMYFKLQEKIADNSAAYGKLKRDYFANIDHLYFNCKVEVSESGANTIKEEYIPGYAEIESYGLVNDSVGWVRLKHAHLTDKESSPEVNPVTKAAWQFARVSNPDLVFDDVSRGVEKSATGINSLAGYWNNIAVVIKGYNRHLRSKGYGSRLIPDESWIRLCNPVYCKYGGGARVQEISFSDAWDEMVPGGTNVTYGQKYTYEKEITLKNGQTKTISSGVASYEPLIGADENPFHEPIYYDEEVRWAPNNRDYIEKPLGESFFPSPLVGYSKVKVESIGNEDVGRNATGYTITEFYTAQDFPTIVDDGLEMDRKRIRTFSLVAAIFGFRFEDNLYASQGYAVELNDMHGKPKAQYVYQNNETPVSKVIQHYFVDPDDSSRLENRIPVLYRDGTYEHKLVGIERDVIVDNRFQKTESTDVYSGSNLDAFLAAFIPIVIPSIWPQCVMDDNSFQSLVITKVVHKYGILAKTEAWDLNSRVETKNLAFDAETGEVLLTSVNNEFKDSIFNFELPAHWVYPGMQPAYENTGLTFEGDDVIIGMTISQNEEYFNPGDEILWTSELIDDYSEVLWIHQNNGRKYFTNRRGILFIPHEGELKIIRSGKRNMLTPRAGQITSMKNPIVNGTLNMNSDILNASATEYTDWWQTNINAHMPYGCDPFNNDYPCNLLALLNLMNTSGLLSPGYRYYSKSDIACPSNDSDNVINLGITDFFKYEKSDSFSYYATLYDDRTSPSDSTHIILKLLNETGIDFSTITSFSNFRAYDTLDISYKFYVDAELPAKTVTLLGFSETATDYISCTWDCDDLKYNSLVNPYMLGLRGNWRPKRGHTYLTDRVKNNDLRTDGLYSTYDPFWQYSSTKGHWIKNSSASGWVWTKEVSKFDPHGFELENRDPLNRYQSELPGYNYTLPVAVAQNAKHNNIAFDGFEEYVLEISEIDDICVWDKHFNMDNADYNSYLNTDEYHTGYYSIEIDQADSVMILRELVDSSGYSNSILAHDPNKYAYHIVPSDLIYRFSPDEGDYQLSAWAKEVSTQPLISYTSPCIAVYQKDSTGSILHKDFFYPSGNIIEGWQQISGKFHCYKTNVSSISVHLVNTWNNIVYFDDLRIHPFNSNIKTFVYDPYKMNLMAELDENNYATFYEYDNEGKLIRIKKETVDGIKTLQESRTSMIKN